MSQRLLVGTRKGLFVFEPQAASRQWNLVRHEFAGIPVTAVLDDQRSGHWFVGLRHGHFGAKLHRSVDGGLHWQEEECPAFPPEAAAKADGSLPAVDTIWSLAAAGPDMPGVLLAGTIPAALFISNDDGASWGLVESLWDLPERANWLGGGTDNPGLHSICIDPRDSDRVSVGISSGGVWRSEDGCASWRSATQGMMAAYMPPERQEDVSVQDPHRVVSCPGVPETFWCQHRSGIFRSGNDLASWEQLHSGLSDFGFAVAVHPTNPDIAWFVPAQSDECQIPQGGDFYVMRTRDGGKSFEKITAGLPPEPAYHLIDRHALAVNDGGRVLAFGSTTGSLWTSSDEGGSWLRVSAELPPILCITFIE